MTIEELNSPDWSDRILALPEEEQPKAITAKILDAQFDVEVSLLESMVRHHKLLRHIIMDEHFADTACEALRSA